MLVHVKSSMFMNVVYEKCCVLTTWKDIDFHVNGNEQFIWVIADIALSDSCKKLSTLSCAKGKYSKGRWTSVLKVFSLIIFICHVLKIVASCIAGILNWTLID